MKFVFFFLYRFCLAFDQYCSTSTWSTGTSQCFEKVTEKKETFFIRTDFELVVPICLLLSFSNGRSRPAINSGGSGPNRFNSNGNFNGTGGPMRHHPSWSRHDSRPYDPVPMDSPVYHSGGYGPSGVGNGGNLYDRSRSDTRNYYNDHHENSYGAPTSYNNNGGQMEMYSMRDYRNDSGHHHDGNMNYGSRG